MISDVIIKDKQKETQTEEESVRQEAEIGVM